MKNSSFVLKRKEDVKLFFCPSLFGQFLEIRENLETFLSNLFSDLSAAKIEQEFPISAPSLI